MEESYFDGHVYVFLVPLSRVLTYDSDRALMLSTIPKLTNIQKSRLTSFVNNKEIVKDSKISSKFVDQYFMTAKSMDSIEGNNISKEIMLSHLESFQKFIGEVQKERTDFIHYRIIPKDLKDWYIVKPRFTNDRIKLQSGLFLISGLNNYRINPILIENLDSINSIKNSANHKTIDTKVFDIKICRNNFIKILNELKYFANITYSTIYGTISDTAKYFSKKKDIINIVDQPIYKEN